MRRPLASTLLGGVVLGVLWRVAGPFAASVSDRAETAAAEDGSFVLLAAVDGVISAVLLHHRLHRLHSHRSHRSHRGASPVRQFLLVLGGSVLASGLAVGLSVLTGGPRLTAWGGLAVWPLVLSGSVLVVTAQGLLAAHDDEPEDAPDASRPPRADPWIDPNDRQDVR